VKETIFAFVGGSTLAEDVLQNGVKETQFNSYVNESWVEGVIKEGVKHTLNTEYMPKTMVEDIIQSGVKHTGRIHKDYTKVVEYLIENGVKETKQKNNALLILDNSGRELILESHLVIRDGVKITSSLQSREYTGDIDEVLENGVKETNYDTDNYTDDVKEVIREGVKETSHRQFLKTYDVKDTIQDGTEHDRWILDGCASPVDVVLDNGVKTSHPRQYVGEKMIDKVIDKGVIETHGEIREYKQTVGYIIQTGVKETKTPGNGDIASTAEWMKENNSTSYPKMIDDVIENGVKEIRPSGCVDKKTGIFNYRIQEEVDDVVDNGVRTSHPRQYVGYIDDIIKEGEKINGTYAGGQRQSEKCKSVVEYGTKNPTD